MASYLTIADAAAALRSGEVTSVELTKAAFAAADRLDPTLGVYISRFDEPALAAAQTADDELAGGLDRGPLHGIPLGVKDIIATDEGPTTAQSLILDRSWGEQGDAPVVARLRAAGAVITGKTTTYEFAIGVPDPAKPFPIPRNPWNTDCTPGGSSAGTGAGVAGGLFLGGLGTDTGGSVRWPAACCGISGLKQTFGRVPKYGCVPLGYSYDNIGPMARSAYDCALMLQVMAGHDSRDACSVDLPVPDYVTGLTGSLAGVRIGIDMLAAETDPALVGLLEAATAVLADAGATVTPVTIPMYSVLKDAAFQGFLAEAFAYHKDDLASRWFDYGAAARMALGAGAFVSGADYVQAQRVRRVGQRLLADLFTEIDLLITPTVAGGAMPIEGLDLSAIIDSVHTPTWNATGHPALALPVGFTATGLPLSMQIVGRPFEEAAVLGAGHAYQQRTDWHRTVPPMAAVAA